MSTMTTRDLFGYAGSSHQPQDRVLSAEEAYGALGSATLDDEEEYGSAWDDDFGALDSDSLFDEEEYGDDDDEDDFGYIDGDEEFGEIGDDLDELNEELDEDVYGAFYGAAGGTLMAPAGTDYAIESLGDALSPAGVFLPTSLQSAGVDPGWIEWGLEKMLEKVEGGDTNEIAAYLMNEPNFGNWNSLSGEEKQQMVYDAIVSSAIPGLEMAWDEPLRQAWASNDTTLDRALGGVMAVPSAIWKLVTTDQPNAVAAWIKEIPGFADPMDNLMAGLGVSRPDQIINVAAIRYFLIGLVYPQVYGWIADAVTRQGQEAISAVAQSRAPASAPVSELDMGILPMPPPPQAIPSKGMGLPCPTSILAAGYGFVIGGSVLGFLS